MRAWSQITNSGAVWSAAAFADVTAGKDALLAYALIELPLQALTLRMTRGTS
ncbi:MULTISPECIES: hypothetical protein [unclassified Streptomyces]|uniref:hypothetical protein n=1 Tax=unclassified Streptomyces TaxID=2593676 RepID=UPI002E81E019|nr:hypothetical protein [Streptomyces sp. NBC_00589]WTI40461.1 hypothetical protein OIC96_38435 [Streptomyces sp. NBC_00775]WUB25855.1 hypothetical protein OHA51_11295 [Streptomyces sp. NBC_00589]